MTIEQVLRSLSRAQLSALYFVSRQRFVMRRRVAKHDIFNVHPKTMRALVARGVWRETEHSIEFTPEAWDFAWKLSLNADYGVLLPPQR